MMQKSTVFLILKPDRLEAYPTCLTPQACSQLLGFSTEGDTSLPLVRKPPDPGNNTTVLYSSDAPASSLNTSLLTNYLI